MGQTVTTPLSLTLDYWSEVRDWAADQGVDVKRKKWITLCEAEWVMMNVGWPRGGTFHLDIISQVEGKVFVPGPHGHPDQGPYIATWRMLAADPPLWVRPFLHPTDGPKSTRPDPGCSYLNTPPSSYPSPSPPSAPLPPSTTSALYPVLQKEKLAPVLPSDSNHPLIDLLSEEPPPYPPEQSQPAAAIPAPAQGSSNDSPIAGRLRDRRGTALVASQAFPLREGPGGRLQYWPFSASDLYNWKQQNPPFSKDPVTLINLIDSLMTTHQPTWDDCQQLLQTLLTAEERQRVYIEARKQVPGPEGHPTIILAEIDAAFPLTRPEWDFGTPAGRDHLCLYRRLLVGGLRAAARRPTNLAQVKQVIQKQDESPPAFLERLKGAYRMYTPYDPEDPGQAGSLILSFIWQSSPDIRAKLQRLEGLQGMTLPELLREAEKVYNKRETPEEKEERLWQRMQEAQEERDRKKSKEQDEREKKKTKDLAKILATVVRQDQGHREGNRKRPPLDKDQCAYCKEKGHWARDCPKNPRSKKAPGTGTALLNLSD